MDTATGADPLGGGVEEGRMEGRVVEIFEIPPPEAPVGVVEGVDEAEYDDERVGDGFERLGSDVSSWRWG